MANEARQPKFKVEDIVRLIDTDVLLKITGVEPCLGSFRYDAVDLMGTKYTCVEAYLEGSEYKTLNNKEETDMTKFTEEDIAKDKSIDEKFERMGMTDFNPLDHNIVVSKGNIVINKENPFDAIIAEIQLLHENKNADYGDSFAKSVEKYGLISALTRISDKFNRAEQLILGNEAKVKDEKLRDTLIDLASYAIMTIVELDKTK